MNRWIGVLFCLTVGLPCGAVPFTVELSPVADAFVRSMDPGGNYGGAGGLSVSGSAALNKSGEQMGTLDTFMRFDASALVAAMDAQFGGQPWAVTGATLALTEQGAPNNSIFNRGVGQFDVRWIAADAWAEGTGTPKGATTDGVCFSDEVALLDPASDLSLGIFTNAGADGEQTFELSLPAAFLGDIVAGGDLSLFLTAASDAVGFTFNAKDIPVPRLPPLLAITADVTGADQIPEPSSMALLAVGVCALARGRRRQGA